MENKYNISHMSRLRMGTDGEGIRELIFTCDCPLRCKYCINKFTWNGSKAPELLTASQIYNKVKLDRPYILATNGGITIGGGEPLLQPELFRDLRQLMEKEMTLYAETSFNIPYDNICQTEENVDRYYVDIKTTSEDIYRAYTGGNVQIVMRNIKRFIEEFGPEKIVVRIPMIPNYTDRTNQLNSKKILESMGVEKFNLFEYRISV